MWFAEKLVKGILYKDVLNLEATVVPNGWGPRVGWKFYPKSDFLNVWDSLLAVMVIWVAIMEPIRVGFSIETGTDDALYWFELVVDILFMLDLIVCMRTCFFVRDEWENLYLVQDLGQISARTSARGSSSISSPSFRWRISWRFTKLPPRAITSLPKIRTS